MLKEVDDERRLNADEISKRSSRFIDQDNKLRDKNEGDDQAVCYGSSQPQQYQPFLPPVHCFFLSYSDAGWTKCIVKEDKGRRFSSD